MGLVYQMVRAMLTYASEYGASLVAQGGISSEMIARRMLAQASSHFPQIDRALATHPEEIKKALNVIMRMLENGLIHVAGTFFKVMS